MTREAELEKHIDGRRSLDSFWSTLYNGHAINKGHKSLINHLSPFKKRPLEGETDSDLNAPFSSQVIQSTKPVSHGLELFSNLLQAVGLFQVAPVFSFESIRLDLNRNFVNFSYAFSIAVAAVSMLISRYVFSETYETTRRNVVKKAADFINMVAFGSELSFILIGPITVMYILYQRRFLQEFIVYKCSSIRLPKIVQRAIVLEIFSSILISSVLAEPLYTLLIFTNERFVRPKVLPNSSSLEFGIIKVGLQFNLWLLATILCISAQIVPMMTCFMSCVLEKHLELDLKKYAQRLIGRDHDNTLGLWNSQLANILSENCNPTLSDYSPETLCCDWPTLEDETAAEQACQKPVSSSKLLSKDRLNYDLLMSTKRRQSLLMLKNLVINLIELRSLIKTYERVFGYFHLVTICSSGLLVADWIVVALVRVRVFLASSKVEGTDFKTILISNPPVWQTSLRITMFFLANVITFNKFNQLPDRIAKLHNHLFKINLELSRVDRIECYHSNWQSEIEKSWILYDEIVRISRKINFRLAGKTHYGKKNLILIFSREISLILLYLQILDIYTTI